MKKKVCASPPIKLCDLSQTIAKPYPNQLCTIATLTNFFSMLALYVFMFYTLVSKFSFAHTFGWNINRTQNLYFVSNFDQCHDVMNNYYVFTFSSWLSSSKRERLLEPQVILMMTSYCVTNICSTWAKKLINYVQKIKIKTQHHLGYAQNSKHE